MKRRIRRYLTAPEPACQPIHTSLHKVVVGVSTDHQVADSVEALPRARGSSSSGRSHEIPVAIFDDNVGFRESLATLISTSPGFRLAGAYSDVPSGLEELGRGIAEVVLLDVQMPGMSGIEGARQIRSLKPGLPVVMLTAFDDSERVFESLRAGAVGYLLKRSTTAEILGAIQEAVAGGSPMSGRIARMVVHSFHPSPADLPENHNLSARERELLEFLAEGLRYKEVADRMSISLNTVRCYIRRVYEKLQAQSRTEALRRYQGR